MSKMQMLMFAVGIAVVAILFYNFITSVGLSQQAETIAISNAKLIADQLNNDLLCSDKFTSIPDRLTYGMLNDPLFYDLEFSRQPGGIAADTGQEFNNLIVRVTEHKSSATAKKTSLAAKIVTSDAKFVLVDPTFIFETSDIGASYKENKNESITIYPRAASKSSTITNTPNAFVALKEVKDGLKTMYIIPCSTEGEPNNCVRNVLRLGCHLLKISGNATADSLVPSCFNISTNVTDNYVPSKTCSANGLCTITSTGTYTVSSKTYTLKDCACLFNESTWPVACPGGGS